MKKSEVKVDIEFNSDGFKQILLSDGVKNIVESETERIKAEANAGITTNSKGYSASVWQGHAQWGGYDRSRWLGHVIARDAAASAEETENQTLSKAVHG